MNERTNEQVFTKYPGELRVTSRTTTKMSVNVTLLQRVAILKGNNIQCSGFVTFLFVVVVALGSLKQLLLPRIVHFNLIFVVISGCLRVRIC